MLALKGDYVYIYICISYLNNASTRGGEDAGFPHANGQQLSPQRRFLKIAPAYCIFPQS